MLRPVGRSLCIVPHTRGSHSKPLDTAFNETLASSHFIKGTASVDDNNFTFHPFFFSSKEQETLLRSSLKKLDATGSQRLRRQRRARQAQLAHNHLAAESISSLFLPEEFYEFEKGHYDGVIRNYREMHLTSWPEEDAPSLSPILKRLEKLTSGKETQTHLLHLSSEGEIYPHVDNLYASGSWILGISLGSPRVMRLQNSQDEDEVFDVLLPSGSVYLQRDDLRFNYKHSILKDALFKGHIPTGGQRLSIMIRDVKRNLNGPVSPYLCLNVKTIEDPLMRGAVPLDGRPDSSETISV